MEEDKVDSQEIAAVQGQPFAETAFCSPYKGKCDIN